LRTRVRSGVRRVEGLLTVDANNFSHFESVDEVECSAEDLEITANLLGRSSIWSVKLIVGKEGGPSRGLLI
jgi:hypothetical protein